MTYLVLARKWRPRSFDTLVGQEHVVRALRSALSTGRLHHAWLFTGTRGVGKTTLSRILAKALNCAQGITATPCGQCEACVGIEADRYVDYLELDAASNRGVEDMSRLLDQAVYAPTAGRFKVYMIDEVHMLTGHAFNAMLKTLEEPPPHVKFILATTDPQKIPVTVLSRCLQFNLKQMPPAAVADHLAQVLQAEGVPAEPGALRLLGQAARGSMRDALSLTDQAIAYGAGSVLEAGVRDMLGVIDQTYLVRLLLALVANDGAAVLAVADELATRGLSYTAALDDLATLLAQVAMAQRIPGLPTDDHPQAAEIRELAAVLPPDAVQLFYSIALHSRAELALAPDEHAGFLMTCLRMLAFVAEGGSAMPPTASGAGVPPPTPAEDGASVAASAAPAAAPVAGAQVSAARAALASLRSGLKGGAAGAGRMVPPAGRAAESPRPTEPPAELPAELPAEPQPVPEPASAVPQATVPPPAQAQAAASMTPSTEPAPEPGPEPEPEPVPDLPWHDSPEVRAADTPDRPMPDAAAAVPVPTSAAPAPAVELAVPAETALRALAAADWPALAAALPLKGLAGELARQTEWVGYEAPAVVLRVATRALAQGPSAERLRGALAEHFGTPLELRFEIGQTGEGTAHAVAQSERDARQREAEAAIAADPFVQALVDDFHGQVLPGSIRPL